MLGSLSARLGSLSALVDEAKQLGSQLAESALDAARSASSRSELVPFRGYPVLMDDRPLAEGGFAFVHLARHAETGKLYAVKRMLAQDADSAKLARAERKVLSELPAHPNVVRIFAAAARRGARCDQHFYTTDYTPILSSIQLDPDCDGGRHFVHFIFSIRALRGAPV